MEQHLIIMTTPTRTAAVEGTYEPAFEPLVQLFAAGIGTADTGAALGVIHRGRSVVDVWSGHRDQARTAMWSRQTLAPVMSVGKAMLAAVMMRLSERGMLDLEAPVAEVWPEFATHGKQTITPMHVLTHTAGLPFHDAVPAGADWTVHEVLAESLQRQAPRWEPGSTPAYHSLTLGTLVDAIVRRVTGQSVADWFDATIARSHSLEVTFGQVGDGLEIAETGPSPQAEVPSDDGCVADPACRPEPAEPTRTYELINSARFRRSEWPSINCFATARGIAGFYAALIDADREVLSENTLADMTTVRWAACERSGGQYKRMGLGVNLGATSGNWFAPDDNGFGHGGKGGATGFADRQRHYALGYVTNSLYEFDGSGPRTRALSQEASRIVCELEDV